MQPLLMVSLLSVLLMLPPLGIGQAAPRDKERDGQERLDRDRAGFEFRGRDRDKAWEDRVYEEREDARDFQQDRAEVERALRKAAAERDRALEKAHAEAAREGQPVKLRQKQTAIWEKYEEKRYDILTKFEDKREQ
jgi:hypothetical protein